MGSNRLEILIGANTRELSRGFREVDDSVDKMTSNLKAKMSEASLALAGLAAGGAALTGVFISKASEMEQFEARLKAIMGSSEAAHAELARLADFASKTPFELPQVVEAATKLRALGVSAEKFLPIAGNLAAAMGKDLVETSMAFGKAVLGIPEGITQMTENFGITKAVLVQFGAALDSSGAIANKTAGDIEKLQNALIKVVQSKFGNAMAEQEKTFAGAMSTLKDSVGQFAAEIGTALVPMANSLARSLTTMVEGFRALSPATKTMIAEAVVAATAIAGVSSVIVGLAAVVGPLALAWQGLGAGAAIASVGMVTVGEAAAAVAGAVSQAAVTAGLAAELFGGMASTSAIAGAALSELGGMAAAAGTAVLAALGPIGVALVVGAGLTALTASYQASVKAAEDVVNAQLKVTTAFNSSKQAVIAAADAIKKYGSATAEAAHEAAEATKKAGLDDVDVHRSLAVLLQQQQEAEKEGNTKRVDQLEERIKLLRMVALELSGLHTQHEKEKADAEAALKSQAAAAQKAFEAFKANRGAGVFVDPKAELAALDAVMAGFRQGAKEYEELALDRVKLARTVAEQERKERLAAAQYEIDVMGAAREVDKQAQLAKMKEILTTYQLTAEERRRIQLDIVRLETDIEKDGIENRKKLHDKELADLKALADAKVKASEVALKTSDLDLKSLDDRLKRGEDVAKQIAEEIAARSKLAAEIAKERGEREAVGKSPAEAAAIRKNAEQEATNAIRQGREQIEQLDREQSDKKRREAAQETESSAKLARAREEHARKRFDMEGTGEDELKKAMLERQTFEEEALRKKFDADSTGKDEAEKMRLTRELEMDLLLLKEKQTNEQTKLNAEIEETKKKVQELRDKSSPLDLSGEAKSVADAFANQGDSFKRGSIYSESSKKPLTPAEKKELETNQKTQEGLDKMGPSFFKPADAATELQTAQLSALKDIASSLGRIEKNPVKVQFNGNNLRAADDTAFKLNRPPGLGGK